jgi:hypothetical protein
MMTTETKASKDTPCVGIYWGIPPAGEIHFTDARDAVRTLSNHSRSKSDSRANFLTEAVVIQPPLIEQRLNDSVIRRPIADEGRLSCRKPALLHHAALATFSGPACSMARM